MKRLGIVSFAVFALLATSGASIASAKTVLVARTKAGAIPIGGKVKGFSSNLIFETTAGNLECEENELLGKIEVNEATKVKGKIEEEFSRGNFEGIPGACKTSATGPVLIKSSGFPWPVEFTTKGQGKTKGTKKVAFDSEFVALSPPNNHCTFEAATVKFVFNTGTIGHPEVVTEVVSKQKFVHNKKAPNQSTLCPTSGLLSGTFSVSAGPGFSEAVESELKSV